MIKVTALDGKEFILNADHIEKVEDIPECLITLTNGRKYVVQGNSQQILHQVIEYKRKIYTD
ncbi:flagellar FlbD family protein [Clostridium sp. 19966]|uniref:flagellar FlbD family protein n=1 Tax=Clostridium sp. 19966 TaxID=2768166 RepID=UPI0028DE7EAC|nr:flagellar FlbD family protein [Clostridium sp. 19966]MDT8716648.1 flagellar FlbD family protein [Clostridium sp. 19966]